MTETPEKTYYVPQPPAEIFDSKSNIDHMIDENAPTYLLDHFDYDDPRGIQVYHIGCVHPRKGFPTPEAIEALGLAKKALVQMMHIGCLISFKGIMADYAQTANYILRPHFLKPRYMTPVGREITKIPYFGLFPQIVGHIFEYDDAYRYRLQDIISETTEHALVSRPLREMRRLLQLSIDREPSPTVHVSVNKRRVKKLVTIMLLWPPFRTMFRKIINSINIENMKFDEDDKFWVCAQGGYRYMGLTDEERDKLVEGAIPQAFHIKPL